VFAGFGAAGACGAKKPNNGEIFLLACGDKTSKSLATGASGDPTSNCCAFFNFLMPSKPRPMKLILIGGIITELLIYIYKYII
jgi:hypothetical protein